MRIVGQDGLAADDTRYFTVAVKPAWRVLVAAPKPPHSYALFLTEALAPAGFRKRGQARFDCDICDLAELAKRPLADYAAVCLLDPTPLEPATWQKLADYAAEGHGVAIFLGRNALPVDSFNEPQAQELLPGKLLRQAPRPDGDLHLAPRDYQHPILAAFRGQAGAIPWDAFPCSAIGNSSRSRQRASSVVLPYNDGRPAMLERPVGQGRVLTMTTPVSDRPSREPLEPAAGGRGLAVRDPGQPDGGLSGRQQRPAVELFCRADGRAAARRGRPAPRLPAVHARQAQLPRCRPI